MGARSLEAEDGQRHGFGKRPCAPARAWVRAKRWGRPAGKPAASRFSSAASLNISRQGLDKRINRLRAYDLTKESQTNA